MFPIMPTSLSILYSSTSRPIMVAIENPVKSSTPNKKGNLKDLVLCGGNALASVVANFINVLLGGSKILAARPLPLTDIVLKKID